MDRPLVAVIDGDVSFARLVALFLSKDDCRVVEYRDPDTAVASLRADTPDLVFLDTRLGHADAGLAVLDTLAADPALREMPVIVCSADVATLRARACFRESQAMFRALGDVHGIASSLLCLGALARDRGNYATGRALLERSAAMLRRIGDTAHVADALCHLAWTRWAQGDADAARGLFAEPLRIEEAMGGMPGIARCLEGFAALATEGDAARDAQRALVGRVGPLHRLLGTGADTPRPARVGCSMGGRATAHSGSGRGARARGRVARPC